MSNDELIQLRALLVEPAIAALKAQAELHQKAVMDIVTPAISKVDGFENRVHKLETELGVLLKGAIMYSTILSLILGGTLNWIRGKIFR
jgi:hypothetical protein